MNEDQTGGGPTYTLEQLERDRERQIAEEKAKEAERRERTERERARQAWRADGGTDATFDQEWPKLRDEARRRRVADADKRARGEFSAQKHSRI